MKKHISPIIILTALLATSLFFTSCGSGSNNKTEDSQTNEGSESSVVEESENPSTEDNADKDSELQEEKPGQDETETEDNAESEKKDNSEEATDGSSGEILKKCKISADEVGIYSVTIELNDQAADKAVLEMVYTGAKGTAEEGSVVNTYRIEYYKDSGGKYEISTYYNGNTDRNLHQQAVVKVDNTFGAATRAADVVITYTPDGGEAEEIFRGYAEDYQ